jgi:hypothetical protein
VFLPPAREITPAAMMIHTLTILAQTQPSDATPPEVSPAVQYWRQIGEHFQHGQLISPWWVVIAAGFLLILVGALSFRAWHQRHGLRSTPLAIFNRIAGELGLTLSEQWLLLRVARHQRLPTPLTLLLSHATLEHHVSAFLEPMSRPRRELLTERFARIRKRLFA